MADLFARKISPVSATKTDSAFDVPYQVLQYFKGLEMTDQYVPGMYYWNSALQMQNGDVSFNTVNENLQYPGYNFYIRIMAGTKPTQEEFDNIMLNTIPNRGASESKIQQALEAFSDRNYLLQFPLPANLSTFKVDATYPHDIIVKLQGDDTLATVNTSGTASWWYVYSNTPENHTSTDADNQPSSTSYNHKQNMANFPYCIGDVTDVNGNGEIKFANTELTQGEQYDFNSLSFRIPQQLSISL